MISLRRGSSSVLLLLSCSEAATLPSPSGVGGAAGMPSGASGVGATSVGAGDQGGSAVVTAGGAGAAHGGNSGTAGLAGGSPTAGSGGTAGAVEGGAGPTETTGFPSDARPVTLSTDSGYCWFEDPRALFVGERLLVGSVASGWSDAARRGDIEAIVYDFETQRASSFELHDRLELDDHDSAAFLQRPDGRVLAMYAKHGTENHSYYRVSTDSSLGAWGAEKTFTPTAATRLTYSNLFLLSGENNRIYDFYRGLDDSYKPSFAYSDDLGETWKSGNVVVRVPSTQKHRPYVRYASNGTDTIHLLYTEAHPRDFDNSLYHVYYKAGVLHASSGAALQALTEGLNSPDQGTRIFQGDADHVAWGMQLSLDNLGRPVAVYSVQLDSAGLPTGQGGQDIRYRYARWDGTAWRDHALAFGGSKLYSGEDDYSGLGAIDPTDPSVVYISTDADPATGAPLKSAADGARHHEIFRGTTSNGGETWQWSAVTKDSAVDNLRPVVPAPSSTGRRALLWLRGTYTTYTNYKQELVAISWHD